MNIIEIKAVSTFKGSEYLAFDAADFSSVNHDNCTLNGYYSIDVKLKTSDKVHTLRFDDGNEMIAAYSALLEALRNAV